MVAIARQGGKPVWGEPATAAGPLEGLVVRLIKPHQLALDPALKRNGQKCGRFLSVRGATRLPVDLSIATPESWGNQPAIRTGNVDFSRLLVTSCHDGGCMPDRMFQRDGYLWRSAPVDEQEGVDCPEVSDFFRALGLPVVPPTERNADTARRLRKGPGVAR